MSNLLDTPENPCCCNLHFLTYCETEHIFIFIGHLGFCFYECLLNPVPIFLYGFNTNLYKFFVYP